MSFNWGWVSSKTATLNASETIDKSTGSLYSFRAATRGQVSASELSSAVDSLSQNADKQWKVYKTYVRPFIDSLPAGTRDNRWRNGTGLPEKVDALNFGIQGTTLFVLNDATSSIADGRYWHSTQERPKTIAESIEDLWDEISNISSSTTTSTTSSDLTAVWAAIGVNYYDSSSSAASSLDGRLSVVESYFSQFEEDIYEPATYAGYGLSQPLSYSVANNIDVLLKLHGITGGWQSDPTSANHTAVSAGAHTHAYSNITPNISASLTTNRVTGGSDLEYDIRRLRYEIEDAKGTANWYTSAAHPWGGSTSLQGHINLSGSGTQSAANPHGLTLTEVDSGGTVLAIISDLGTLMDNLERYTGMTDAESLTETPTYSSTSYVANGDSLETAIGKLDNAINVNSSISRYDTTSDRSGQSYAARVNNPIVVSHNIGRIPILQVLDLSPEQQDYYGQYMSPATDVSIDHIDVNTTNIWTDAEYVQIIAIG